MKLQITVTGGDITKTPAPVVVAGQYKGVAPLRAVESLDKALGKWITQASNRGMIGGNLGELFFIPVLRRQIEAQSILLASMGEYGHFTYSSLCYLMMNVTYAISALGHTGFSTVLIGSGSGGLRIADALKGMLSGICDALDHIKAESRVKIKELEIIELDENRHREILKALESLRRNSFRSVEISVAEKVLPGFGRKRGETNQTGRDSDTEFVNRITIEHGEDGFQFSALTNSAVVPVRKVEVQRFFTDSIAKELKGSGDEETLKKFGRLLHRYIFPEDFEQLIQSNKGLTIVVDKTTAALPWEMACLGPDEDKRRIYFGRDLRLTRQFRSMLSAAPGIAPPVNKSLKFLVIADPAAEEDLQLEGARREGEQVKELLEEIKKELSITNPEYKIEIVSRIGDECRPVELLALILDKTFDVIHYSGHGIFDEKQPNNSGWVFGRNYILSAREIFRTRQVPRLVFANACFSAVVRGGSVESEGKESPAEQANQKLAGLAEAFFARGVQNYVGTGWKVDDEVAVKFATEFYRNALRGEFLSQSLANARTAIFECGSTWGAYQFYGQSNARIAPHQPD